MQPLKKKCRQSILFLGYFSTCALTNDYPHPKVSQSRFISPATQLTFEYLLIKYNMSSSSRSTVQFTYGLKKKNSTTLATYWLCSSIRNSRYMKTQQEKRYTEKIVTFIKHLSSCFYGGISVRTCLRSHRCGARHMACKTWILHSELLT